MWHKFLENPFFLNSLYNKVPRLDSIEIISIQTINDGPAFRISLNLPRFADKPPKKWNKSYNTVRVNLEFSDVTEFHWTGWGANIKARIVIEQINDLHLVLITGEDINISFKAKYIRIENINGFCIEQ